MISHRTLVEACSRWVDRVAATPARRAEETRLKFKMICANDSQGNKAPWARSSDRH